MSSQTLLYLVTGVAVLGLLIYQQLAARPVQGNQRLMLILLIVGLGEAVQNIQKLHTGAAAVIALIGSLMLNLVVSLVLQRVIITMRPQRLDPAALGWM